jgi:molybdate transport system substrate-binding protein
MRPVRVVLALALGLTALSAASHATETPKVLVFAASSLQTALDELASPIEQATGIHIVASYAASSALARQIEDGAPADLFISADVEWMDYLAARRLIRANSRVNLLGNQLVLVAPARRPVTLSIAQGFALASHLGPGRLALGDPASVPAGKYAKAALTSLGVWDSVASKLAPAENVRAALRFVSRGEAPLGIVYRTDALADGGVVIVDTFPESSHPRILYPAALAKDAAADAGRVLTFLEGAAARTVFIRQGFLVNPQ